MTEKNYLKIKNKLFSGIKKEIIWLTIKKLMYL